MYFEFASYSFFLIHLELKRQIRSCTPVAWISSDYFESLLGTLRSENGDVHEIVVEKWTSHPFRRFRDYPNSPCYLKEGNFGWSWREGAALEFRQRWENLSPCRSRTQVNLKCGHFTSLLCRHSKDMYKKAWSRAELLFCSVNLLFFWFLLAVAVVVS